MALNSETMKTKLPKTILAMIEKRGGLIDIELRASREQLIQTCKLYDYPPHPSVIAFEEAFGGLVIPDEGIKIEKGEPSWIFGAHASLSSGGHTNPRGGRKKLKLVPVVCSPNDIIYYLDENGHGYAEDLIEDESAVRFAENGIALVCRILLNDLLFSRQETSLDLLGLKAEELSVPFSLALIKEASGEDFHYFIDPNGDMLVVEDLKAKHTNIACATKKQLTLVMPPVASNAPEPPAELLPFIGKSFISMCGEKRTSIPEFFGHLPDLRELDVSINKLETLPASLWRATQLAELDISFNPLKELPEGIGNMKALRSLHMRGCLFKTLPDALAGAKNLTNLNITECEMLDLDAALEVIARLPKLNKLSLPLSRSLRSLAPLAKLPLKSLYLNGARVQHPDRLPAGLGQLKKLTDLGIQYADDIALLPKAPEDIRPLRLIFSKRFTDDDIRQSLLKQPEKLYLRAFADSL